jgi:glycine/D-amino acid oxidase-like deaminating enzyme
MRLLVLGGGPAGLNAALQARELNAQVTLIEPDQLGGPASTAAQPRSVPSPGPPGWSATPTPGRPSGYEDQALRWTWPPRSTTPGA